ADRIRASFGCDKRIFDTGNPANLATNDRQLIAYLHESQRMVTKATQPASALQGRAHGRLLPSMRAFRAANTSIAPCSGVGARRVRTLSALPRYKRPRYARLPTLKGSVAPGTAQAIRTPPDNPPVSDTAHTDAR